MDESPAALRDAIDSALAGLGSSNDISANLAYKETCAEDLAIAYLNGGCFSEIIEFWANRMGSGLLIEVQPLKDNAMARGRAEQLQQWLDQKFFELDVLGKMISVETSNAIGPGAAILLMADNQRPEAIDLTKPLPSIRSITELIILPRVDIEPNTGNNGGYQTINPEHWSARNHGYLAKLPAKPEAIKVIDDRLIPVPAKLLPVNSLLRDQYRRSSNSIASVDNSFDRLWGQAWIGPAVLDAAKQLDAGVAIALSILAKKNALDIGIKNLISKLSGPSKRENQEYLEGVLHMIHAVLNRRGVYLSDMDDMAIDTLEFSLAGIADVIQLLRKNLLLQGPDIPEIHLFGARENGGINQSSAKYDEERVDGLAQKKFESRWVRPLKKIVRALTLSKECPFSGYPEGLINVARIPGYQPSPLEVANTRIAVAQAEQAEMAVESARSGGNANE